MMELQTHRKWALLGLGVLVLGGRAFSQTAGLGGGIGPTQETMPQPGVATQTYPELRSGGFPGGGGGGYGGLGGYTTTMLYQNDPRFARLSRTVDVTLDHATVRQLAEALSRSANVPIAVDKSVSEGTRITVDARAVPLATVLEAVARQAKLMIAPDGVKGVILRTWPSLQVNGQQPVEYVGTNAPWSDEWTAQAINNAVRSDAANIFTSRQTPSYYSAFNGGVVSGTVSVTAMGDKYLVVAEPGSTGKGETGVWMTVYRQESGKLSRMSTTFHRSAQPEPTRALISPPGQPGMSGAMDASPVPLGRATPLDPSAAPPSTAAEKPSGGEAVNPTGVEPPSSKR